MKILATFIILLTLCSFTLNKKSMKSETDTKKTKVANTNTNSKTETKNKSDPGAILPAAAVTN